MKQFVSIVIVFLLMSCSSTQLVNNWKNPDIDTFETSKIIIVGMTSNTKARKKYERQLQKEYQSRGITAVTSLEIFDEDFRHQKKTKEELKEIEQKLLDDGFDAIILSKIIGIEDKIIFSEEYGYFDNTHRGFKDDYFMNQDVLYNRNYYEKYKVYHAETSLYCICPENERELIWKGYIDIIDPKSTRETIDDYINLVIFALEEQQLINKKIVKESNEI